MLGRYAPTQELFLPVEQHLKPTSSTAFQRWSLGGLCPSVSVTMGNRTDRASIKLSCLIPNFFVLLCVMSCLVCLAYSFNANLASALQFLTPKEEDGRD